MIGSWDGFTNCVFINPEFVQLFFINNKGYFNFVYVNSHTTISKVCNDLYVLKVR